MASVTLEELGLGYEVMPFDRDTGAQKRPEYLRAYLNERISAIVDHDLWILRHSSLGW